MNYGNGKRTLWGIFFLLAAGIVLLNATGILPFEHISLWNMFWTIVFAAMFFSCLRSQNWGGILFPIAFLCILYDDVLGIQRLTPWPILGATILASIGLSIIFKKNYPEISEHYSTSYDGTSENCCDSNMVIHNTFTGSAKYINTDQFESAKVQCTFGALKLYFDHATLKNGMADVCFDVAFSGVELYVPKTWKIENYVRASFGAVDFKNQGIGCETPVLRLHGNVSFGAITITYI